MASAFAILMSSASKRTSSASAAAKPSRKRSSSAGELVECPACTQRILLSFVNEHLESCRSLDRGAEEQHVEAQQGTPSKRAHSEAVVARPLQSQDSIHESASASASALASAVTAAAASTSPPQPPQHSPPSSVTGAATSTSPPQPPPQAQHSPPPPPQSQPAPQLRSGTVHDFFGGHDYTTPAFLVLNLENPAQWTAKFQRTKPPHATLVVATKWDKKDLFLMYEGAVSPLTTTESSVAPTCSPCYRGQVPLLKSHLQKCIRRCRVNLAASTARELSDLALDDLVRRLPIIMIEDVCLQSWLPVLIWIMVAVSKEAMIRREVLAWLLGATASLAECKQREPMHGELEGAAHFDVTKIARELKNAEYCDILYALQLRRSFGGMKGDLRMLDVCTERWLERFKRLERGQESASGENAKLLQSLRLQPVTPIEPALVPPLALSDWELSAVDFHVSNIAEQMEALDTFTELLALAGSPTSVIWSASSGRSLKTLLAFSDSSGDADETSACTRQLRMLWDRNYKQIFNRFASKILHQRCSLSGDA